MKEDRGEIRHYIIITPTNMCFRNQYKGEPYLSKS